MPNIRRRVSRALAVTSVVAMTAVGLSACVGRAGAVAVVNGKAYNQAQLDAATKNLNETIKAEGSSVTESQLLSIYVMGAVGNPTMAAFTRSNPSDKDVCSSLTPKGKTVSTSSQYCTPFLMTVMRAVYFSSVISQAAQGGQISQADIDTLTKTLSAAANKASVQLNARYGVFDPANFATNNSFVASTAFPWAKSLTQTAAASAASSATQG